jgi:hypothetical protein
MPAPNLTQSKRSGRSGGARDSMILPRSPRQRRRAAQAEFSRWSEKHPEANEAEVAAISNAISRKWGLR